MINSAEPASTGSPPVDGEGDGDAEVGGRVGDEPAGRACRPTDEPTVTVVLGMSALLG